MSKKAVRQVPRYDATQAVFDEFEPAEPTAPETAGEQGEEVIKSQRVTFLATADTMKDLTDLVNARTFRGIKVEGGIKGTKPRKPSASIILNQALSEYMSKPEVQAELAEYRAKF